MTPPIALLQWIAAELNFSFRPAGPVEGYLPTRQKLAAQTNLSALFGFYLADVQQRWQAAQTAGLIDKLKTASGKIAEMNADPNAYKPILDLPQSKPTHYDERLLLDISSGPNPNILGRDLASGAAPASSVTDYVEAVIQLSRIDDVLIRVLAAKKASDSTGQPMAEIMALYRTEGNLCSAASSSSFNRGIPSNAPDDEPSSINYYPPNPAKPGTYLWPQLVWLSRLQGAYGRFDIAYPATTAAQRFALQEPAVLDWADHLTGFDALLDLYHAASSMTAPFGRFSQKNWTSAGHSSTIAEAQTRWTDLVNNMAVVLINSGQEPAIAALPLDPVALIAAILAEAQMYMRSRTALPASLAYLFYHAGNGDFEDALAVITSALLDLNFKPGSRFRELRAEVVADNTFTQALTKLESDHHIRRESDPDIARAWLKTISDATKAWFTGNDPVRVNLVADFFQRAGHADWTNSWEAFRGNVSRYLTLLDYYKRVFP